MTTFTREDFEHAARAAGLRVRTWDGHTGTMCAIDDDCHGRMWMPHHDDGDALRLAVALRLGLTNAGGLCRAYMSSNGDIQHPVEQHGENPCAATRLAIFRAAIAIGKATPAPEVRPNRADTASSPGVAAPDQQLETLKTKDKP